LIDTRLSASIIYFFYFSALQGEIKKTWNRKFMLTINQLVHKITSKKISKTGTPLLDSSPKKAWCALRCFNLRG